MPKNGRQKIGPTARILDIKQLKEELSYHATRTREKDSTKEKEEKTIQ